MLFNREPGKTIIVLKFQKCSNFKVPSLSKGVMLENPKEYNFLEMPLVCTYCCLVLYNYETNYLRKIILSEFQVEINSSES